MVLKCACGQVELEVTGAPIVTTMCHCDDCQRGSHALELLAGAPRLVGDDGGTGYVLFRRDRFRVVQGAPLLEDHRIKGEAHTRRVTSACCHTPLFLDFEKGHWVSLYRINFPEPRPRVELHLQTRFIPAGVPVPTDAPGGPTFPFAFVRRLLGSRIAMLFGRK